MKARTRLLVSTDKTAFKLQDVSWVALTIRFARQMIRMRPFAGTNAGLTGGEFMPPKVRNNLSIAIASGLLTIAVGISGCSSTSASNIPVDCDVVKTQTQAGQTDAQIASNLSTSVDKVAACHGPEKGGNANTLIPEKGY